MKTYERVISVIMLFIISGSNLATPVAYAAQLGKFHIAFPRQSSVDPSELTKVPTFAVGDHGSVLAASSTLFTIGTQKLDLQQSDNSGSANKRIPLYVQKLDKKVYETTEDVELTVVNPDNEPFTTSVTDADNQSVPVPVTESNNGLATTVDLAPSNQIKPGLYKVTITDDTNKSTEQDFTWGVLALNTDKSMYHPGEKADIAMAVLNDQGDMVCDANLELRIQNSELGIDDTLSTNDASSSAQAITVNPQCQHHDYSLQPDYEAHYQFGGAGTYNLQLTATTTNGTHTITDSIQVTDKIPFDVQRVSATRIYPPNTYPMVFNITANRDFNGTVTETVPDSFTITPATQSAAQSYTAMQTVYLNSNDPSAVMSQNIASGSGGLVMPFHGSYPITQGFGAQLTDPTLQAFYTQYGLAGHDGIDFGVPMNTPLYAVDDGTVIWSGPGDYGTMVTILHSWGQTYYGHMSNTSVTVGQHVVKGQLIGYSGMSGEATGPHLHFGMKPNNPDMTNGYYGKIDPMPFLPIGQGEPITALGASANPVENLAYNSTVLGASDSAATPTPSDTPIPTVSPTPQPTATPTPTAAPTPSTAASSSTASGSAVVSQTPTPTPTSQPSVFTQPTTPANTNFSVLDKEIKINEQIANNALTDKVKVITWRVKLKKGQSTSLGYAYQTPKVSPQFYLLGPATFYSGGNDRVVFQEDRQWQIASDDVGIEWYTNTSMHKWNGYSWQYRKKIDIDHTKVVASAPTVTFMDDGGDSTEDDLMWDGPASFEGDSAVTNGHTGPYSIQVDDLAIGGQLSPASGSLNSSAGRLTFWTTLGAPSSTMTFLNLATSGGTATSIVDITASGDLQCSGGGSIGSTALTGAWARIAVSYSISGSTVSYKVYLNGTQQISCSVSLSGTPITTFVFISSIMNFGFDIDDVYADTGSDESDPGDIRVTAKLPISNGASNGYSTVGTPTGDTVCTSGTHCEYVNERPEDESDYLSTTTTSSRENFTIQGISSGDVNLTSDTIIADQAWINAELSTSSCTTAKITNNGTDSTIPSLTSSSAFFYSYATITNATYPTGTQAVGIQSCSTSSTTEFLEGGMMIAFTPTGGSSSSLTNFPVEISLSGDPDLNAHAQSSGTDILFTDSTGENILQYEIESYSAGTLVAWVKIPSLSSTTDTIIYMYYGNPSATSQANAPNVWDSNYIGVWHFGNGTTLSMNDSTGNNNTATNGNGATATTGGQIDGAATLGTAGIETPVSSTANNLFATSGQSWTTETWFKNTATGLNNQVIVGVGTTVNTSTDYASFVTNTGLLKVDLRGSTTQINATDYEDSNWHSLTTTWDGTTASAYVDGGSAVTLTVGAGTVQTNNICLGATNATACTTLPLTGGLDEVRVSNTARSANWVSTEYNNEHTPGPGGGGFVSSLGNVETDIYAPTLGQLMRHGEWFNSEGTVQPFVF